MGGCLSGNRTPRKTQLIPPSPIIPTASGPPFPVIDPNLNSNPNPNPIRPRMVNIKVTLIDGTNYELVTEENNTVNKLKRDLY